MKKKLEFLIDCIIQKLIYVTKVEPAKIQFTIGGICLTTAMDALILTGSWYICTDMNKCYD